MKAGKVSPNDPTSMEWFCEQMMKFIEDLEKQETNKSKKIRLVKLYGQFEKLGEIFHALSLRR